MHTHTHMHKHTLTIVESGSGTLGLHNTPHLPVLNHTSYFDVDSFV